MKRQKVDSSMAKSVGYDAATRTLEIEFRTGQIWKYYDVPESVFTEMIKGSIGRYFQEKIQHMYEEERVR